MPKILITVPVWNEALIIEHALRTLNEACADLLNGHDVVIDVVDNASTDDTRAIIDTFIRMSGNREAGARRITVRLRSIPIKGKGIAVKTSWLDHRNDADVFVFLDADLSADISALPKLIGPVLDGRADAVCGSRFQKGSRVKRSFVRTLGSYAYRALQRIALRLPVRDAQCGFKAASPNLVRSVLASCDERGWIFDTELLLRASRSKLRIIEIPVSWIENRIPERRSAFHVFKDGWEALKAIVRLRRNILQ